MCNFEFSKHVNRNLATSKNGTKKAVSTHLLNEREHSGLNRPYDGCEDIMYPATQLYSIWFTQN